MKKLVASIVLGTLLVVGFSFSQSNPTDTAIEIEPGILSIGHTSF